MPVLKCADRMITQPTFSTSDTLLQPLCVNRDRPRHRTYCLLRVEYGRSKRLQPNIAFILGLLFDGRLIP